MPTSRLASVLAALVLLTACGGDDGGDDGGDVSTSPSSATTSSTVVPISGEFDPTPATDDPVLDAVTVSEGTETEPVITLDGEVSSATTHRRILSEGTGEVAIDGASVTFHFVAVNGRTGERFDGTRPEPTTQTLDASTLLPGIYRALLDVPAGSRVVAAIAPADAFGPQGGFPDLGVRIDDTLVFVFDVLDVTVPLERATGTPVEPAAGLPTVTLGEDGAPSISLPEGDPPEGLIGQVLIEGDGDVVEAGQEITVHYTGVTWPRGEQFDSSWDRGSPTTFGIGVGRVIDGWDETLVGQPVGSQLLLVIPPDKGYGSGGNPDAGILGTDTLVFVVDILAAS